MSNSSPQSRKNWGDNVFEGIPVSNEVIPLANQFVQSTDYAADSLKAIGNDLRKFATWFTDANREPLAFERVTARDIADCRDHLRRDLGQASATVNRCLVTLRRFFGWLAENGHLPANPAKKVKQLRKQELAPKGLERSQVRKLLREVELRTDIRAQAIFNLFLFTGFASGHRARYMYLKCAMCRTPVSTIANYSESDEVTQQILEMRMRLYTPL